MKELIDAKNDMKMMVMVMGGIQYGDDSYVVYSIRRDEKDANIFVSRLIQTSGGYKIDNDFKNGEKEVLDKVIQRIISKEAIISLENDGFKFIKNIELVGVNYFDIDLCYVATVPRKLVKDCLIFYDLVNESVFQSPVVDVKEDKRLFNEGFVGNLFLVIFGIFILVFCIGMVAMVFFK